MQRRRHNPETSHPRSETTRSLQVWEADLAAAALRIESSRRTRRSTAGWPDSSATSQPLPLHPARTKGASVAINRGTT